MLSLLQDLAAIGSKGERGANEEQSINVASDQALKYLKPPTTTPRESLPCN
jgi:hypothetical protein